MISKLLGQYIVSFRNLSENLRTYPLIDFEPGMKKINNVMSQVISKDRLKKRHLVRKNFKQAGRQIEKQTDRQIDRLMDG